MESSGESLPVENLTQHNGASSLLDRSDDKQLHSETQQIAGASAADESAIISAAKGIGSIDNGRTNIKQAFLFFKGLKLSNSESGSTSIVDKRSTISTRTTSLDRCEAGPRYTLPKASSSSELRLSESSAGEPSRPLVATPNTHPQRRKHLEWISCNRTSCLAILGIVLLCVVTMTVVSALYVTHVLPGSSDSSAPLKEVSSVSSPPFNDTVPTVSKTPSTASASIAMTSTSATSPTSSSSKSTTSGETTMAQPSTTSSLPSSTVVPSSQPPSPPLSPPPAPTPAPTPIVTSFVTSTVPGTLVSTCKWGCYGWDCTANPCNSLWQCINGYCMSSTITSAAAATGCVWNGGNLGDICGNDNCCSDQYTCTGGTCKNTRRS